MVARIHYISPGIGDQHPYNLEQGLCSSFLFDLNDPARCLSLFQSIFNSNDLSAFSLTLKLPGQAALPTLEDLWVEQLSLLLCHPEYINFSGHNLVAFHLDRDNAVDDLAKFIGCLEALLLTQGISILPVTNLPVVKDPGIFTVINDPSWIEQTSESTFYDYYLSIIQGSNIPPNFFLFFDDPAFISRIKTMVQQAEDGMRERVPYFFELVKKYFNKSFEQEELQMRYNQLEDTYESLKYSHDILLGKFDKPAGLEASQMSEVMRIKSFYFNEYEILPLWYKRLGHIIKVVKGKRTFRSLFDKNVEKYKE